MPVYPGARAKESSPGRKPWERGVTAQPPKGAEERSCAPWLRESDRYPPAHAVGFHLLSFAHPELRSGTVRGQTFMSLANPSHAGRAYFTASHARNSPSGSTSSQ
jgi:hypothetical protein